MEKDLVVFGICVVLPIMIVWLVNRTRQNETNRKTEIMLKAIESGATIDATFFRLQSNKTIKERLLKRLTGGCIFSLFGLTFLSIGIANWIALDDTVSNDSAVVPATFGGLFLAIGISLFITFIVGKKMLAKEIAAEEKTMEKF